MINVIETIVKVVPVTEKVAVIESKDVVNVVVNNNGTANIIEEELNGVDGIIDTFTTTQHFKNGTTRLYVNGIKEQNYTEISNNQISLSFVPSIEGFNDKLIIQYEVL